MQLLLYISAFIVCPHTVFPQISQQQSISGPSTELLVQTTLGTIRGQVYTTPTGTRFKLFWGVPYAQPTLRFQKPQAKQAWQGIYDATKKGPKCIQADDTEDGSVVQDPNSSDDCLYLKIMIPETPTFYRYPVLFWPHGGGFNGGSNRDYDINAQGDNFLSKGVAIAQPTYRVGALGFFGNGTADSPGNYAMWDLLTALQYLRDNIAAFGGDPGNVILMGQGAGGVAASMMTFSPLAQGLFSRAILLGASVLQPMVNTPYDLNAKRGQDYLEATGCNQSAAVQCLQGKTTIELLTADVQVADVSMYWHPVMDGPGGIWPEPLEQLALKRRNVPDNIIHLVILGTSNDEQAWDLLVAPSIARNSQVLNMSALNSQEKVREECVKRAPRRQQACISQFLDRLQSGNYINSGVNVWLKQSIQVGSSMNYHAPVYQDAKFYLASGNPNVFLYSFDYVRNQGDPWWQAVGSFHNLELSYIENFFVGNLYKFTFEDRDAAMRTLWANIITTFANVRGSMQSLVIGNVTWVPLPASSGVNYLSIDVPWQMKEGFHTNDVNFWNNITAQ